MLFLSLVLTLTCACRTHSPRQSLCHYVSSCREVHIAARMCISYRDNFRSRIDISLTIKILNQALVGIASFNTYFSGRIVFTRVSVPRVSYLTKQPGAGLERQDGRRRTSRRELRYFINFQVCQVIYYTEFPILTVV